MLNANLYFFLVIVICDFVTGKSHRALPPKKSAVFLRSQELRFYAFDYLNFTKNIFLNKSNLTWVSHPSLSNF